MGGAATYRGDLVADVMARPVKGPTTYGALALADRATYDAETDRTRVEFVHLTPEVAAEQCGAVIVDAHGGRFAQWGDQLIPIPDEPTS